MENMHNKIVCEKSIVWLCSTMLDGQSIWLFVWRMRGSKAFVGREITESQTIMLVIRFSEQGGILFTLSASLCQDRFTESLRALLCAVNYIFKEACVEHPEDNDENPCQAVCNDPRVLSQNEHFRLEHQQI